VDSTQLPVVLVQALVKAGKIKEIGKSEHESKRSKRSTGAGGKYNFDYFIYSE
jgi:hypothetical protein